MLRTVQFGKSNSSASRSFPPDGTPTRREFVLALGTNHVKAHRERQLRVLGTWIINRLGLRKG